MADRDDGPAAGVEAPRRGLAGFLLSGEGWPYLLVPFIPIAVVLELVHASPPVIFFAAATGVIPTAALMGRATEELADRSGPGIGGLLNVTFGNFPELLIAFFALIEGLQEVVKASIIGSILGNLLLVLGVSMFAGGLRRERQTFNPTAAGAQATMLVLASGALAMPAFIQLIQGGGLPTPAEEEFEHVEGIESDSLAVAIVLLVTYAGGLWFSLVSHRDVFNPYEEEVHDEGHEPWSVRRSVILLAIAGIGVGIMSEVLVGSISETAESIGLSEFFIGIIIVAVVGNAAEHWVAVYFAVKDRMDLSVNIAIGSSAQVALFVAPVLVVLSFFFGPEPMPLVFNGYEVAAVLLAGVIATLIALDGESTWFEGLQLLALYVVLGITFFYA
jgi:Ca2+:H+ antiporter